MTAILSVISNVQIMYDLCTYDIYTIIKYTKISKYCNFAYFMEYVSL